MRKDVDVYAGAELIRSYQIDLPSGRHPPADEEYEREALLRAAEDGTAGARKVSSLVAVTRSSRRGGWTPDGTLPGSVLNRQA